MIGLSFREQLPPIVADELDSILARLQKVLDASTGTADGTSVADILLLIADLRRDINNLSAGVGTVVGGNLGPPGADGEDGIDGMMGSVVSAPSNVNMAPLFLLMGS
jgi:hypothetical protein